MTYRTEGRVCVATIEGQTYRIPDVWLVGATQGGRTIGEAVALWHEQARLEALADAERSGLLAHFYSEALAKGSTGAEARQYAITRAEG